MAAVLGAVRSAAQPLIDIAVNDPLLAIICTVFFLGFMAPLPWFLSWAFPSLKLNPKSEIHVTISDRIGQERTFRIPPGGITLRDKQGKDLFKLEAEGLRTVLWFEPDLLADHTITLIKGYDFEEVTERTPLVVGDVIYLDNDMLLEMKGIKTVFEKDLWGWTVGMLKQAFWFGAIGWVTLYLAYLLG